MLASVAVPSARAAPHADEVRVLLGVVRIPDVRDNARAPTGVASPHGEEGPRLAPTGSGLPSLGSGGW